MSPKLLQRWGSKEIWLRALFVRAGLTWLLRDELIDATPEITTWLSPRLAELADAQAHQLGTNDAAFNSSLQLLKEEINDRIQRHGGDSGLERLRKTLEEADACDPLHEMFKLISRNTRNIYRSDLCRRTKLKREWLIGHPYGESYPGDYPDPYHVNAQTRVVNDAADVELQVHLDNFDIVSLLAVPALFTHELVCHAHAREDRGNGRSIWAEGVMDWTASFFFETWAARLGLPYGPAKFHGRRLWDNRMTPWRHTGRLAADALVQWFTTDRSVRSISVAKSVTAKFTLQANVLDVSLASKDMLASRMVNIRNDLALQEVAHAWRHDGEPLTVLISQS